MNAERMVRANGVDLCVETFGDPADPAILLISGAAASMDWWDDELCRRLAAGGRLVVRYDHRDTGRSVSCEPGAPQYTGLDLVADAVGVLDALGVAKAHVAGISMGGGIAQRLALDYPDRVASLVLLSTSPAVAGASDERDLPPASAEVRALFTDPQPEPDWSDREAVIDYIVEAERPYAGSYRADDARKRRVAARIVDRTTNIRSSMTNHWLLDDGEPTRRVLGEITAPTLVMHGSEDPLFPPAHGEALADEIPGARLLVLEGAGHEVPPREVWDSVVPAILEHTS